MDGHSEVEGHHRTPQCHFVQLYGCITSLIRTRPNFLPGSALSLAFKGYLIHRKEVSVCLRLIWRAKIFAKPVIQMSFESFEAHHDSWRLPKTKSAMEIWIAPNSAVLPKFCFPASAHPLNTISSFICLSVTLNRKSSFHTGFVLSSFRLEFLTWFPNVSSAYGLNVEPLPSASSPSALTRVTSKRGGGASDGGGGGGAGSSTRIRTRPVITSTCFWYWPSNCRVNLQNNSLNSFFREAERLGANFQKWLTIVQKIADSTYSLLVQWQTRDILENHRKKCLCHNHIARR